MSSLAAENGNSRQGCAGSSTELEISEVYFLVLHWLSHGPCKHAAEALLKDATQHGLLPHQYDIHGGCRPSSYQSLLRQHSNVPADALLQLLQQCLSKVQEEQHAGAQGLSSLLAAGPLAALPALTASPAPPQVPPWMKHPAQSAALPQLQLLQQTGLAGRHCNTSSNRLPLQYVADRFQHHATFRGHGFSVFALTYDKDGRRVVTGADDAIIKIWSLETGLLLVTGRGHTGEITDLSLSADGSMVASGSVDGDVRIWSMMDANLGQNTAILRGHTAQVTLIDFHPTINSALISASADGSVRLWDARDQHFAPLVLLPTDSFGAFGSSVRMGLTATAAAAAAAGPAAARRSLTGMLGPGQAAAAAAPGVTAGNTAEVQRAFNCCGWSPDGAFIVAGGQDCSAYVWHWGLQQQQQDGLGRRPLSGAAAAAAGSFSGARCESADGEQQQPRVTRRSSQSQAKQQQQQQQPQPEPSMLTSADWPVPSELQKLSGHKNEIVWIEFSHEGTRLATASNDGSVRVWQLVHGSKGRPKLFWQEAIPPLLAVAVEPAADTAAGRHKQRPREQAQAMLINYVAWAADDSKILAVASDHIIRVWCSYSGALLQLLSGHTQSTHVLETHPYDARLALSAGFDGQVMLWDIAAGTVLKKFSSSDTIPLARGCWAPPVIQLCGGYFSPDGNSFCVADVAGQFSLYAVGSSPPLLLSAPYDQFFKKDYDPIMHDDAGFAAYTEPAGVPTYHLKGQQPLCDNQFMPYPDDFQAAYREGRVYDFVKSGGGGMCLRGSSMALPSSLQLWPPTVTAAVWKALEDRAALINKGSSRIVSEATARDTAERHALQEHSVLLAALMRGMTVQEAEQHALHVQQAAARRQQQQQGVRAAGAAAAAAAAAERASDRRDTGQRHAGMVANGELEELDVGVDYEDSADMAGSDSDYDAGQVQTASDSEWEDQDDLSAEEVDYDSDVSNQRQGQRQSERQRNRRQRTEGQGRSVRSRRRNKRARPQTRRTAANTPQRQQRKRRRHSSSSSDGGSSGQGADEGGDDRVRRGERRSSRRAAAAGVAAAAAAAAVDDDDDSVEEDDYAGEDQGADQAAAAAASRPPRQQQQDGMDSQQQRSKRRKQQQGDTAAVVAAGSSKHGRPLSSYSWLRQSRHSPNAYVPQLGDAVVYLFEGHRKYLDARNDRLTGRPWELLNRPGVGQQQWLWQQQCQGQQQQQQSVQDWQQQLASLHQQAAELSHTAAAVAPSAAAGEPALHTAAETIEPPATAQADAAAAGAARQPAHGRPSVPPPQPAADPAAAAAVVAAPQEQTEYAAATAAAAAAAAEPTASVAAGCIAQGSWLPAPYQMRPAEPCTVVNLEYIIQDEHTVVLLTLQLTGAAPVAALPATVVAGGAVAANGTLPPEAGAAAAAVSQPSPAGEAGHAADPAAATSATAADAAASSAAASYAGCGYLFQVVLPHPSSGHADFVILLSRFQESINRTWQVGERVQNYLLEDLDGSSSSTRVGSWWLGTVAADRRIAQPHCQVAADPFGCGGLWERYKVNWDKDNTAAAAGTTGAGIGDGVQTGDPVDGAANINSHERHHGSIAAAADDDDDNGGGDVSEVAWLSPWELYEAGLATEAALAREHVTQMTTEQVARLLHAIDRMRHTSKYRQFIAAPPPDAEYVTDDGDLVYNRIIALPMGLQNIQERLEAGYYRSLQALLHDAALIAANSATFNGPESPLAVRALELCNAIQAAAADPELEATQQQQQQRRRGRQNRDARPMEKFEDMQLQQEQQHGQQESVHAAAAAAAAAVGPMGVQERRSRRSAASKASVFLAGCVAAGLSDSDNEGAIAAAAAVDDDEDDPEADEALAAAAATAAGGAGGGSMRARSSKGQPSSKPRRHRARNRRRGGSSSEYDSDGDEVSERERLHHRPQRRSTRQQQQQKTKKYREDYASDYDSEGEGELDDEMQQQRGRRNRRRQQQQEQEAQQLDRQSQQYVDPSWLQQDWMQGVSPPFPAAAAAAEYDELVAAAAEPKLAGMRTGTEPVTPSCNGAATVAAVAAGESGSRGRIKMKLGKPQQQPLDAAAVHLGTAPYAAADGQPDIAAAGGGPADLWNGQSMHNWSTAAATAAAAAAAQSLYLNQSAAAEMPDSWQQLGGDGMQWFHADSAGQFPPQPLVQQWQQHWQWQQQQQQNGWDQEAPLLQPADGAAAIAAADAEAAAASGAGDAGAAPDAGGTPGGSKIRIRMRTRSSGR